MVSGIRTTWEEETSAKYNKELEELNKIQRKIADLNAELIKKQDYVKALQKVLEFNRQGRIIKGDGQVTFDPEKFLKQSVRDTLFDIAANNNGLLVVNDAVTLLVESNVFSERDRARNQIYSNINHYKKYFNKERPGIYRLKAQTTAIALPLNA
jgi:hypothetical protein